MAAHFLNLLFTKINTVWNIAIQFCLQQGITGRHSYFFKKFSAQKSKGWKKDAVPLGSCSSPSRLTPKDTELRETQAEVPLAQVTKAARHASSLGLEQFISWLGMSTGPWWITLALAVWVKWLISNPTLLSLSKLFIIRKKKPQNYIL